MRLVVEADLRPAGWVCESCKHPLRVGEYVFGVVTGVYPDGTVTEGEYRCRRCARVPLWLLLRYRLLRRRLT